MIDFAHKSVENEKIKFANMTSKQKLVGLTFDDAGFKMAIARATRDLTTRTLKNISQNKNDILVDTLNGSGDSFLNRIKEYFNGQPKDEEAFDIWHNENCVKLLTEINRFYRNSDGTEVCYGKAQKILNMTLKGCYCLNGANEKEEYFKYCHVPLDSFTLEWFSRDVVTWFNKKPDRGGDITKGRICSWSVIKNINAESNRETRTESYVADISNRVFLINSKDFYHYSFIQDIIRNYFEDNREEAGNITPLQAEFIIWPEIQLHLAAESLFGQSIGQEEMIEKINEVQQKQNAEALCKKREELAERIAKGKSKNKTVENDIAKLEKAIDGTEEANKIYKNLPLDIKIELLSEKIELIKSYCNIAPDASATSD